MPSEMPEILIIRPIARALDDVQICIQLGWKAVPFSPIEMVADDTALQILPNQFNHADVVFWVSPTAIEIAAPCVQFLNKQNIQVTVGQSSYKTLSFFCPHHIVSPDCGNDSEAVLKLSLWKQLPDGARILIIRGHGGRDFLTNELIKQGFNVEVAEVYFRRPIALNWQEVNLEKTIAAYVGSSEWVHALFAQIPPHLARFFKTLLYLTHHPRIAQTLKQAGAENVHLVAKLDRAALDKSLVWSKHESA